MGCRDFSERRTSRYRVVSRCSLSKQIAPSEARHSCRLIRERFIALFDILRDRDWLAFTREPPPCRGALPRPVHRSVRCPPFPSGRAPPDQHPEAALPRLIPPRQPGHPAPSSPPRPVRNPGHRRRRHGNDPHGRRANVVPGPLRHRLLEPFGLQRP